MFCEHFISPMRRPRHPLIPDLTSDPDHSPTLPVWGTRFLSIMHVALTAQLFPPQKPRNQGKEDRGSAAGMLDSAERVFPVSVKYLAFHSVLVRRWLMQRRQPGPTDCLDLKSWSVPPLTSADLCELEVGQFPCMHVVSSSSDCGGRPNLYRLGLRWKMNQIRFKICCGFIKITSLIYFSEMWGSIKEIILFFFLPILFADVYLCLTSRRLAATISQISGHTTPCRRKLPAHQLHGERLNAFALKTSLWRISASPEFRK